MTETHQFCTFYLAHLFCGLAVEKVQEVIRYQSITRVPLAPPAVRGLINLRGQIVPAVDLQQCLDLSASLPMSETQIKEQVKNSISERSLNFLSSSEQLPLNVVMRTTEEVISLLVDEVGEVLEIADSCFEPPPETLTGKARDLIQGVYKLDNQLLLIIDTEKVVEVTLAR